MREIPLTKGYVAIVDDADFELVSKFKWHVQVTKGGAPFAARRWGEGYLPVFMHREISECPLDLVVDHINGDPLDNRRSNLRCCTRAENSRNIRRRSATVRAPFIGVTRCRKRWSARIFAAGAKAYIGTYDTPEEAAQAYDRRARQVYGAFAPVNFPEGSQSCVAGLNVPDEAVS